MSKLEDFRKEIMEGYMFAGPLKEMDASVVCVTRSFAAACAASYFVCRSGPVAVKLYNRYYPRRHEFVELIEKSDYPQLCLFENADKIAVFRTLLFYGLFLSEDPDDQVDLLKFCLAECSDLKKELYVLGAPDPLVERAYGSISNSEEVYTDVMGIAVWIMSTLGFPIIVQKNFLRQVGFYSQINLHVCRIFFGVSINSGVKIDEVSQSKLLERASRNHIKVMKSNNLLSLLTAKEFNTLKGFCGLCERPVFVQNTLNFTEDFVEFIFETIKNLYGSDAAHPIGSIFLHYAHTCLFNTQLLKKDFLQENPNVKDDSKKIRCLTETTSLANQEKDQALNELNKIRTQYNQMRFLRDELSKRLSEVQQERDRLKTELDYMKQKSTVLNETEPPDEANLETSTPLFIPNEQDMDRLRELKVTVIGGHSRMRNHIARDFPNWHFYDDKCPREPLLNSDVILVLAKYAGHKISYRVESMTENTLAANRILNLFWGNKNLVYRDILKFVGYLDIKS